MKRNLSAGIAACLVLLAGMALACKPRPERGASTANREGSVMQDTDTGINNPAYTHGDVPSQGAGTIPDHRAKADINRLGVRDFMILGLSEEDASGVVRYRSEHGPFHSVDDLLKVPGVDPAWLKNKRNLLTAGSGATPGPG